MPPRVARVLGAELEDVAQVRRSRRLATGHFVCRARTPERARVQRTARRRVAPPRRASCIHLQRAAVVVIVVRLSWAKERLDHDGAHAHRHHLCLRARLQGVGVPRRREVEQRARRVRLDLQGFFERPRIARRGPLFARARNSSDVVQQRRVGKQGDGAACKWAHARTPSPTAASHWCRALPSDNDKGAASSGANRAASLSGPNASAPFRIESESRALINNAVYKVRRGAGVNSGAVSKAGARADGGGARAASRRARVLFVLFCLSLRRRDRRRPGFVVDVVVGLVVFIIIAAAWHSECSQGLRSGLVISKRLRRVSP